ncbi:hypothetical protein VMT65_24205 [Nocardia sp. CDC153]|uniref:hypothetical protein n=1 Tax=Nocardia sp. CDC153 TaxID=3112167 RepID=UPI002DB6EF81|nr:hypothetical protein [Nocardia sp. CDC153]MEC3956162.1 hypothetical protein [Nocardia sp. CDC153]
MTAASVALGVVLLAPVAGADGSSTPVAIDCTTFQAVVEPSRMLIACGDGTVTVKDITWTSWGPTTAEGDGTEYRVVCQPNCAGGHEVHQPTHVTLRKVSEPGDYFGEAVITDLNGNPETWPMASPR